MFRWIIFGRLCRELLILFIYSLILSFLLFRFYALNTFISYLIYWCFRLFFGFLTNFRYSNLNYIYIYIYIYTCTIFSFRHIWLRRRHTLCLPILSLIRLNLHINRLTFGWNSLRKMPHVSQVMLAPNRDHHWRSKLWNTKYDDKSYKLIQSIREEQAEGKFTEEKKFTEINWKKWWKKCTRHFRMWQLYSKLMLFKENWLMSLLKRN